MTEKIKDLSRGYLPVVVVVSILICTATVVYWFGYGSSISSANAKAIEQFPNTYVTKAEFNATIKAMNDSLNRIDQNTQQINQTLLKYKFEVNQ